MKKYWMLVFLAVFILAASLAQAAYDIKTMTPQIQSALDARKERFLQLKQFKAEGVIGENNRGYVEVLKATQAKDIVNAENADRKIIYAAIVLQNGLEEGAMATVEAVFAGVQRDKADAGEKIQEAGGRWVAK